MSPLSLKIELEEVNSSKVCDQELFFSGGGNQSVTLKTLKKSEPGHLRQLTKIIQKQIQKRLPLTFQETVKLRAFGFLKIPFLFFTSPTILEVNEGKVVVKIPLNRRTRNHLNSMYFGVLAAGADCACGALAYYWIDRRAPGRVSLIFKDFKADFLKRAEGDVLFSCVQGGLIQEALTRAIETGDRQNLPIEVVATVPSLSGEEPVAKFILTLSLKYR